MTQTARRRFRKFLREEACECSYDSLRCCKILDASLKLDGTVFDRFNIDLTGVEVGIRELSNDEFDRFRWGFGFFSSKKNILFSLDSISDFSPIVFLTIFQRFDDGLKMSFQCFPPFYQLLKYFLRIESLVFAICIAILSRSLNLLVHVDNMSMYRQQLTMLRYRSH